MPVIFEKFKLFQGKEFFFKNKSLNQTENLKKNAVDSETSRKHYCKGQIFQMKL